MTQEPILCPSARCEDGAILLGIILPDGRVAFASDRVEINQEFVDTANEGRSPEARFRFAGRCVQNGCKQWTGARCGVIDRVVEILDSQEPVADALPDCSIRPQCRWFHQSGAKACSACPEVITDLREPLLQEV
jgi:hypothetical protein